MFLFSHQQVIVGGVEFLPIMLIPAFCKVEADDFKIREQGFGDSSKLSGQNGFLQYIISRLLASDAPVEEAAEDEENKPKVKDNSIC